MSNNEFARRITELRREKQLSQKELGELLGVSNKAVSKWETGESMPQMKTILRLAEIFEINPTELLTGTKFEIEEATAEEAKVNKSSEDNISESLRAENSKLAKQLDSAKKSRRNTIIISFAACMVFAIIAVLVILSGTGEKKNLNADIDYISNENTYIEYGGERFFPADYIEQSVYWAECKDQEKYAQIVNGDKSERITIYCSPNDNYIVAPTKNKDYIYVSSSGKIELSYDTVSGIYFCDGKFFNQLEMDVKNNDYTRLDDAINSYYIELVKVSLFEHDEMNELLIPYKERKIPDNAKDITKKYLTTDSDVVVLEMYEYGDYVKLGRLFTDDKGVYYLYSFEDSQTYLIGKELKNVVEYEY